uniref:Uncharacterized protein n=1 Tax=Arundo donax TaxID=35708 RepID=A0A0A9CNG5_ARUDO
MIGARYELTQQSCIYMTKTITTYMPFFHFFFFDVRLSFFERIHAALGSHYTTIFNHRFQQMIRPTLVCSSGFRLKRSTFILYFYWTATCFTSMGRTR